MDASGNISFFFSLFFLFPHFPLWKNLYEMTLIEMERRWSLLFEGCLSGFLFLFRVLVDNEERKCYEIRYDLLILTWKNLKIEFFFLK